MFPLTSGSPSFLIKMEEDADKCWTSSQRIEFVALFLTVKHLLPLTMGTWRGVCRTVEGKKLYLVTSCCAVSLIKNDAGGQWVGKNGGKAFLGVCRLLICTKWGLGPYFFCAFCSWSRNPFSSLFLVWLQQDHMLHTFKPLGRTWRRCSGTYWIFCQAE